MSTTIKYYLNEQTNQILVSGSSTVAGMNALLTSSKNPLPIFNPNTTAKISSLGTSISYVVDNGIEFSNLKPQIFLTNYTTVTTSAAGGGTPITGLNGSLNGENASLSILSTAVGSGFAISQVFVVSPGSGFVAGETITIPQSSLPSGASSDLIITLQSSDIIQSATVIPINSDQELWVHRGYQPTNVIDSNAYRYNPHLHRPYKAYILTQTGSGIPAVPWFPIGNPVNTLTGNSSGVDIPTVFSEKQLGILGNTTSNISASGVSGSFEVFGENRQIVPWIFTKYNTLSSPPALGAYFDLFKEDFSEGFQIPLIWDTNTDPNTLPVADRIKVNNSNLLLATTASIGFDISSVIELNFMSASHAEGKSAKIKIGESSNQNKYVIYDITFFEQIPDFFNTSWNLLLANPSTGSVNVTSFTNGASVYQTSIGAQLVGRLQQSQFFLPNSTATVYNSIILNNGNYTYTSSAFVTQGSNSTPASGSTQFGLAAKYGEYVVYNATLTSNASPVRIDFTGSNYQPQYFILQPGKQASYTALTATPSASSANLSSITFQNNIVSSNAGGTTPLSIFSTRIEDVYLSFSSSVSSSIDGLYVFNQLPQSNVQVTASMFLNAWTGSSLPGSTYGTDEYGNNVYGGPLSGGGPTWPTASLRIYTGSFPNDVPGIGSEFAFSASFSSSTIHTDGLAITMSYLIPSESIQLKDCLSISLVVSSGSAPSESVENSLIVNEYSLKFFTPTQSQEGDGRVPTFIENAYIGTSGFSNAFDCQPILNNVNLDRPNPFIQQIDYSSNILTPVNFTAILSGSALKSTVPESNYTQRSWDQLRYSGSRSTANAVNSIEGLEGGFGTLPIVDYLTTNFAYCDQVLDPYPVLNNVTQWNIKYLINEAGDPQNPRLSPYTAFDVEQSWDVGGVARGGIQQISGSAQFDALNGNNLVLKIVKEPVGVLWSQKSSTEAASFIPLAGNPNTVSEYNADYMNYAMNANGTSFSGIYDNNKVISYPNIMAGISSSGNYTVTETQRYGLSGSGDITVYASASIVSESATYANIGEIYFNRDQFAINGENGLSGNQLSDTWAINTSVEIPSTAPQVYRTDAGGWNDSSDYNEGIVGSIEVGIQYNDSTNLNSTDWKWAKVEIASPPIMKVVYNENSIVNFNMTQMFGAANCGIISKTNGSGSPLGTSFRCNLNCTRVRDVVAQQGRSAYASQYVLFDVNIKTANTEILRANRRYRIITLGNYASENVDAPRNYFNPTSRPQENGGGPVFPPVLGPFVTTNVQGSRQSQNSEDNAINSPYWLFPASTTLNQIYLSSSNGNAAYGVNSGYFQGYLPYTASFNSRFPGGYEPEDTTIPVYNIPFSVEVDDEIRFENNESFTFKVIEVKAPSESPNGKLLLTLDRDISPSINKDFFLLRRYRYSPNTIITDNLFPYGGLPTRQEFVATNTTTTVFGGQSSFPDTNPTQSVSTVVPSGSLVTSYFPLTKKDNTPSGFLFPEYPTAIIELAPDKLLTDLRDKKLIE